MKTDNVRHSNGREDVGFQMKNWPLWLPMTAVAAGLVLAVLLGPCAGLLDPSPVLAANVQPRPTGVIVDNPAITISAAAANSTATPTTSAHEAQIFWNFGTVTGTYSTCTVQAKTSYDGSTWLTLGSPETVTVASGAANAWTLIEQIGTTSVTTSAVSSTTALGFGQLTMFTFACSSYGTSAPVTVTAIYR